MTILLRSRILCLDWRMLRFTFHDAFFTKDKLYKQQIKWKIDCWHFEKKKKIIYTTVTLHSFV